MSFADPHKPDRDRYLNDNQLIDIVSQDADTFGELADITCQHADNFTKYLHLLCAKR